MKPVDYLIEAQDDFQESVTWYAGEDIDVADWFALEVERTIDRIAADPGTGHPSGRGTRSIVLNKFPFRVVFAELPTRIVIIAVSHHSRHPGYWLKRLKGLRKRT
ncbi:MAG TPA: type II toxin-antitoxin system RelE/ParE family toxin [Planctomycetaceae bacterium]|nr:type II toxin-antitoxin system RelE/ParE family toxin [Planctomycetaceae bacterium]